MPRLLLAIAMLLWACASDIPDPIGSRDQALMGAVGTNANPLTFWWWAGEGAELSPALECALQRIRSATCLPLDVSFNAHHWVRQKSPEAMAGRNGWTTGADWDSTRIALKAPMGPQTNCRVLVHEIAQHVLRRRNDHAGATYRLDADLLEAICARWDCGCFVPETDDDPLASTQAACIDPFAP